MAQSFLMFAENNIESKGLTFIADSGASDHFVNSKQDLSCIQNINQAINVTTAQSGSNININEKGKIKCVSNSSVPCDINNVLYAPNLNRNLLSVSKITDSINLVVFSKNEVKILKETGDINATLNNPNNMVIAQGDRKGNLYEIMFNKSENDCNVNLMSKDDNNALWHARLGHPDNNSVKWLCNNGYLKFNYSNDNDFCEPCVLGKQRRASHPTSPNQTSRPLELIHSDVCFLTNESVLGGYHYFVTFLDDYTNFATVYLLKSKDEVYNYLVKFIKEATNRFNLPVAAIRTDNGTEYVNNRTIEFLKDQGIIFQHSIRYTPEMNGKAERLNLTLLNKARTMLLNADLDNYFCGEAILCAVYLLNRTPTVDFSKLAAKEWYKNDIDYGQIKGIFGCDAYLFENPKRVD